MLSLSTELRNKLERMLIQARDVAEAGVKAALGVYLLLIVIYNVG
jgi:hypothetical protein